MYDFKIAILKERWSSKEHKMSSKYIVKHLIRTVCYAMLCLCMFNKHKSKRTNINPMLCSLGAPRGPSDARTVVSRSGNTCESWQHVETEHEGKKHMQKERKNPGTKCAGKREREREREREKERERKERRARRKKL